MSGVAWRRRTWPLVAGLVMAVPVLLAVAWLAANVVDDELQPPFPVEPARLPVERNGYFVLAGLWAPEGADMHAAGRLAYEREQARASATTAAGDDPVPEFRPQALRASFDKLPTCEHRCFEEWLAQDTRWRALLARHSLLLARCEALADDGDYEEVPWDPARLDSPTGYSSMPLSECADLLRMRSAVAWSAGDFAASIRAAQRHHELSRKVLTGSRMLITARSSGRQVARSAQWLAEMVARRPSLHADAARAARPFEPDALRPVRWLRTDLASARDIVLDFPATCARSGTPDRFRLWFCSHPPGYLLHDTVNRQQRVWQGVLQAGNATIPELLSAMDAAERVERELGFGSHSFRNTLGRSSEIRVGDYRSFVARACDVELWRAGLAWALDHAAGRVPPPPASPCAQGRLRVDESGSALIATTWEESVTGQIGAGRALRIPLAQNRRP